MVPRAERGGRAAAAGEASGYVMVPRAERRASRSRRRGERTRNGIPRGARGRAAAEAAPRRRRRRAGTPARKPCVVRQPRRGSALVVLIVAAEPDARLVAPLGGAVEPLVHAPEAVQSARKGGIGVVDDAIL